MWTLVMQGHSCRAWGEAAQGKLDAAQADWETAIQLGDTDGDDLRNLWAQLARLNFVEMLLDHKSERARKELGLARSKLDLIASHLQHPTPIQAADLKNAQMRYAYLSDDPSAGDQRYQDLLNMPGDAADVATSTRQRLCARLARRKEGPQCGNIEEWKPPVETTSVE